MFLKRFTWPNKVGAGLVIFAITAGAGIAAGALVPIRGSDTLLDPINRAITLSGAQVQYLGGGSGTGETGLLNHTQGIAPMSRNLTAAIIGPGGTHTTWAPTPANVLGLDAAVIVQKNIAGKCPNIQEFKGAATHWMKLILGGVDGTGSAAACSNPARLEALQEIADCMHVDHIEHFYRRDNSSGTTNTMMEKLGVCGFCNGAAAGPLNTNNADNDPIRRSCVSGPQFAATPCTNGKLGLVVALSQNDPGKSDVTTSIGNRAAIEPQGQAIGYAGREAAFAVAGSTKFNIHGIVPTIANVRVNAYDLSRRLFLQRGDINDPNVVALDPTGEQKKLLAWATGIGASAFPTMCTDGSGNPICGRPNMDPLMQQFGFVSCLDDPFDTPVPPNLCGIAAAPFVGPVCTACGANAATCTTGADCCTGTCTAGGTCDTCKATGFVCSVNTDCCSGTCDQGGFPAPSCT